MGEIWANTVQIEMWRVRVALLTLQATKIWVAQQIKQIRGRNLLPQIYQNLEILPKECPLEVSQIRDWPQIYKARGNLEHKA